MPLNIAFLFSGDVDSPTNHVLLTAIKHMNRAQYDPIILVKNPDGVFSQKLKQNRLPFKVFTGELIEPTTGRFRGAIQTFKESFGILGTIGSLKIDAILSCEMRFLIPWAPAAFVGKKPLFWLQESIWGDYPIATMWSGYTHLFFPVSQQALASLPSDLQKRARLKGLPTPEQLKQDPSAAKKYLESLFKDCI